MGYWEYEPIAARYGVPIIVTGFEPLDLLQGIYMAVDALETGRCEVENQYSRLVTHDGNLGAQRILAEVFQTTDRQWHGNRHNSDERVPAAGGVYGVRRGAALRRRRNHGCRIIALHRRRNPAGPQEATPMHRIRRGMYAGSPARRADGVGRGCMRRLLHVWTDLMTQPASSVQASFALQCPIPISEYPTVTLAHGGGGRLTQMLIEKMFVPTFRNETLETLHDGAVLTLNPMAARLQGDETPPLRQPITRLAFSTDSFVISPRFFPRR